jgi:hypothetical protein
MATASTSPTPPMPNNVTYLITPDTENDNENMPPANRDSTPEKIRSTTTRPTEYYSFTPRGLPRGPRAWERHPAVQRAPRAAGSKPPKIIWKRRPLNNITREINSRWKRGRDDGGEDDGVVRPKKKARLVESDGEDKENVEHGEAQGENEEDEVPLLKGVGYVPLTWGAESVEALLYRMGVARHGGELLDEGAAEHMVDDEGASSISDAEPSPEVEADSAPTEEAPEAHKEPSPTSIGISAVEHADHSPRALTTESMEPSVEMCFDITPGTFDGPDTNDHNSDGNEVNRDEGSTAPGHEGTDSLSPEESLPGPEEVCALGGTKSEITDLQPEGDSTESVVQHPQSSAPAEEDDTAYLQQFLQRAKEARAKSQNTLYQPVGDRIKHHLIEQHNQSLDSASIVSDRKRPHSPEPEDISNIEDQEEPTVTTTILIPNTDEESSLKPSSPSRRSSRISSATKLPRPQRPGSLPSNISLRRLNGTEFISMARQRSEAQSAAMSTRNNTRKNKGTALAVQQRLAQLKLGFADDGKGQASTNTEEDEAPKKKRKKRAVGGVKWAEQIARFQGDDGLEHPYIDEPEADEAAVSTTVGDESTETQSEEGRSSSTPRKSRRSSSTSTPGKSRPKTSSLSTSSMPNQSAESNVKHKRKESTGTVNGTPSVKRSVEKLLEDARESGEGEEGKDAKRLRRRTRSEDAVP